MNSGAGSGGDEPLTGCPCMARPVRRARGLLEPVFAHTLDSCFTGVKGDCVDEIQARCR